MPGLSSAGAAVPDLEPIHAHARCRARADEPRDAPRAQWGVALGVLAVLAVCMVAALNALSTL